MTIKSACAALLSALAISFGSHDSGNAVTVNTYETYTAFNTATGISITNILPNSAFVDAALQAISVVPANVVGSQNAMQTFINHHTDWNAILEGKVETPGGGKSGTLSSAIGYEIWALKFGTNFVALFFSEPVTSFRFSGLSNGLSHYAFGHNPLALTPVPLPPTVMLFGSALIGLGALTRRRPVKRKQTA